jgi:hypothetical protein
LLGCRAPITRWQRTVSAVFAPETDRRAAFSARRAGFAVVGPLGAAKPLVHAMHCPSSSSELEGNTMDRYVEAENSLSRKLFLWTMLYCVAFGFAALLASNA